ncbi:MAG: PorP/SprF family type IX secretion system membrane protein [Capnocytophaga sp.]|nr:PorP/SprF family type IX secretion system membrane protein [Capnocytophaga sp.]
MKQYIYNILFIGLCILGINQLKAQDPSYIFYNQHQSLVNPAAVGMEQGHTVSVDIRNQWQGVVDAPQTQTLFTTHRINDRVGLGFSIANNKVFIQKQAGIYADFSYALQVSDSSRVYAGLKFGGDFFNIDGSRINTYRTPYNAYYDPYLQTISGKFQVNIGTGFFYEHPKFYVGISVPNLLASEEVKQKDDVMTTVAERMHFYVLAGYYWNFTNEFAIKPMFQARFAKDISPSFNFTVAGTYLKNSELGITYRTDNALGGYLLFHIPKYFVAVGYGYESNLQSQLNLYARNSHEFLVQFKW